MEKYPRIELALWRDTMLDAALYRQWLINLGRRNADQRIAHLFCEIWTRVDAIGRAQDATCDLPLTQTDLADALGFSVVHVNKSLRRLREDGLITFRANQVRVHDWERLRSVAAFNPAYLQLRPEPSVFPSNYVEASARAD